MSGRIFLWPKSEDLDLFVLKPDKLLVLLLPLYGLCHAGDYWGIKLDIHITEDLGMTAIKSNRAVYMRMKNGIVLGITGTYVDDSMNAGNENFKMPTQQTLKMLEPKPQVLDNIAF